MQLPEGDAEVDTACASIAPSTRKFAQFGQRRFYLVGRSWSELREVFIRPLERDCGGNAVRGVEATGEAVHHDIQCFPGFDAPRAGRNRHKIATQLKIARFVPADPTGYPK